MTLGIDTAALLLRSIDALMNLIEPAPYALLTPDERRSALRQLLVTTETAAKLAEISHADVPMPQCALGGVPPAGADTKAPTLATMVAVSPKPANHISAMVKVLETLRVQLQGVKEEWVAWVMEGQRSGAVTGTLYCDAYKALEEAERSVALMQAVAAEVESVGEHLEGSGRETGRLQVELDGVKSEKLAAELHIDWIMAQLHEVRSEYVRVEDDECRPSADAERLMGKVKAIEKEIGRYMVKKEKMKAEVERVETAVETSMQVTERLRLELDRARAKRVNIEAEVEGVKVQTERVMGEIVLRRLVKR